MSSPAQAKRLDVKLFFENGDDVDVHAFMPIFQQWIQNKKLPELLIDVADYTHVKDGPGMLLVAHECQYAIDGTGGRQGLLYSHRRGGEGDFAKRIENAFASALRAAKLIEDEPALEGKLKFSGAEAMFRINDRLNGPNEPATFDAVKPVLEGLLGKLHDGAQLSLEPRPKSAAAFTVDIRASKPSTVSDLLGRLGN